MALVASVWAGESGGEFGVPEVIASMPLRLHGTTLQFGSRPEPSWMFCSLIFHFCFCSGVRELGISVGVCGKIPGIRKSGLVRCWHVVLVYFFSQVRRVVGVSAARWVYLRVGLSLGQEVRYRADRDHFFVYFFVTFCRLFSCIFWVLEDF